jgi:dihydroflavonol-4-reductase
LSRGGPSVANLAGLDVQLLAGDIGDPAAVAAAVEGQDAVIHAAAHLAYWRGQRDLQTRINVEGTRNVVAACRRAGVRRLLHVSSVAAVGIPPAGAPPADETFVFNLQDSGINYAVSKHAAEEIVLAAARAGLDAVIANPASLAGPFGARYRGGEMIEKVRHGRFATCFSGGVNIVHIDDVVDGMMAALARGRCGERYILAGENLTYRQIAETAAQELGVQRPILALPPLVTAVAANVLEPLSTLTGKRPKITYEQNYTANRCQYYSAAKAQAELGFAARPYRAIVREYLGVKST